MAFELVRSAFVCYEVLALRALGVADSRTTHKSSHRGQKPENECRYFTGTTGAVLPVSYRQSFLASVQREVTSRGRDKQPRITTIQTQLTTHL